MKMYNVVTFSLRGEVPFLMMGREVKVVDGDKEVPAVDFGIGTFWGGRLWWYPGSALSQLFPFASWIDAKVEG